MPSTHLSRLRDDAGFTLLEILVVILIVGILTAIAVPSFLSQHSKADDACAKAMSKEMFTAMKTLQVDSGNYLGATLTSLSLVESSITDNTCGASTGVVLSDPPAGVPTSPCTTGTALAASSSTVGFCVGAQSTGGSWFAMTEKNGATFRTCSIPAGKVLPFGGCRGSGGTVGFW
jgi:prepilin-type N-terminal cleavage/methylation domain-containing protein